MEVGCDRRTLHFICKTNPAKLVFLTPFFVSRKEHMMTQKPGSDIQCSVLRTAALSVFVYSCVFFEAIAVW
jgi:hypothetical protein